MKASYDSAAEKIAAEKIILSEGYRKVGDYENIKEALFDPDGVPFDARLDFIPLNPGKCTIEFKTTDMNSKKSYPDAVKAHKKAIQDFYQYGTGKTIEYVHQMHSWSNSAVKHAEQHARLPPLSHITVFACWPTFEAIKLYLKLGIVFCHVSGLNKLDGLCTLARHGIATTYSFCTPDGQQVTFPLLSMYQHQLANYTSRDPSKPSTNLVHPHKTAPSKEWKAVGFESAKQKKARIKKANPA